MKRCRGRPRIVERREATGFTVGGKREVGEIHSLGFRPFDVSRDEECSVRQLRDYIPSRLPNEDGRAIVRDLVVSAAYGCGAWALANRIERLSRDGCSLEDCERLNQVKAMLVSQGWDYETLRAMLSEDGNRKQEERIEEPSDWRGVVWNDVE